MLRNSVWASHFIAVCPGAITHNKYSPKMSSVHENREGPLLGGECMKEDSYRFALEHHVMKDVIDSRG